MPVPPGVSAWRIRHAGARRSGAPNRSAAPAVVVHAPPADHRCSTGHEHAPPTRRQSQRPRRVRGLCAVASVQRPANPETEHVQRPGTATRRRPRPRGLACRRRHRGSRGPRWRSQQSSGRRRDRRRRTIRSCTLRRRGAPHAGRRAAPRSVRTACSATRPSPQPTAPRRRSQDPRPSRRTPGCERALPLVASVRGARMG